KDNLERQFRQIQTERDELQEEISNIGRDCNTLIDEKRRLELRINELEGEFEEEQI
ncbi:unnamed protein product, partial [Rotaria magnacalcarata]